LAIKPNENETFYREVDDELRRDQALRTWDRYRWHILIGILLVVAAVGGFIWWQNHRQAVAGGRGEALTSVLDDMEKGSYRATAPRVAELEKSSAEGYRAAGLFSRANLLAEQGDNAGAARIFGQIAADTAVAAPWRDAALVRQTVVEFDRLTPAQIIQRLRPLVTPGGPWLGSAGELVAHAHLRNGRPDLAGRVFAIVARDETVPESIRSRAVQMAGGLGVDATQDAPASGGGQAGRGPAPGPAAAPAAPAAPATKE
jgi:hypothetical protein